MSITIELTPEREARLMELFGSPSAVRTWLENVVAVTTDSTALLRSSPQERGRRLLGQQRGAVSYIAPDFDDPLPDSFWLGDNE